MVQNRKKIEKNGASRGGVHGGVHWGGPGGRNRSRFLFSIFLLFKIERREVVE